MKKIIIAAIQHRWIMVALFGLLAIFGYYSWKQLSIEAYPDIADVTVQVVTQVPGLAAEEVEQQISIPLERALNGLPGLHVMRSKNSFGLSAIILVFEDGVDDYWARQRVQERIAEVDLPYDAAPGLNPLTSPTGEIFRYIIESDNHDLRELTELHKWIIIPRLKQVTGVADVSNFGGITTQFQIEIDPLKIQQYNLSVSDVIEKIEKNNSNAGGSMLNRGDLSYVIRGIGLVKNLKDLGNVVVKTENGVPVYLSDLGKLKYGNLERKGVMGYTDRERDYTDGVEGIVQLLRHQNPSQVLAGIHAAVDELNNETLPKGVNIHPFMDRTDLVQTTLNTVSHTLLLGVFLVIAVLIIFLGSWRGALLVAVTIPLSLLIAFMLMYLTDIPANLLSLGAIDFGIIVEGAIVMMETILKKREDNPELELEEKSIVKRAIEVARPIFFSTIIIITAYLPLFAFERIEKKLFTPMAFTVGYALIGALFVSLLLIPGLAYIIYRKPQKTYRNRWMEKLTNIYHRQTAQILERPKKVIAPLVFVFLAAIGLTLTVGKDFLPELDEGSIWLQVQLPPGISLERSKVMSDTLRHRLIKYDEVTYVMVQTGRDDEGAESFSKSHIECSVGLKPYDEWESGMTKNELIEKMAAELETMPGYTVGFSQPIIDMVMDQIAGTHSDLAVKIYGEDFKENRRIAEEVLAQLKTIPGATDLAIDQEPPLPQLQIHANRDKIAQYGLNVSDVSELIEVAVGGKAISQIFIGERVYDVICRYKEDSRNTPEKIGNLMLSSASGARIPLSQVTDIKLSTGASYITRQMNKRYITLRINLRGIDLTAFLKEAKEKINKNVEFDHATNSLKWSGQFENQNRAYARLQMIIPLALAIMFLLLFGAFGKFRQAALLMGVVPLALFGGMLALNIFGMSLNVSSAVGFISLFGVSIENGVIMIAHINDLRKEGMDLKNSIIEGTKHRFRPIVMIATVAILGLLPASLSTGIGSDVQRPLATVIVYGLLFATIITLYVLPAMFYLVEKRWQNKNSWEVKNSTKTVVVILALFGFTGTSAFAQTDSTLKKQPVSLNQFLQVVSSNNLEYAAEKFNVPISEAAIRMAKVIPDPTFSFDWLENREDKERTGYGFASELGTTIEIGGKRRARIKLAEKENELVQAQLDDYFRNLRADAALVFLEAEKQNQLYLMKRSSYLTIKKLADADSIRLLLGSIMAIDAVQSKLEAGMLMNELLQADANRINSLNDLNLMAGLAATDTLLLPQIDMEGILRVYDLAGLINVAVQNRSDIVSARLGMEVSAQNTTLVKRTRNIDLDVKIGLENGYPLPDVAPTAKIFSAGVGIPLKFSSLNRGELDAARFYEQQTERQYAFVVQKITTEITQAYQYFISTQKQVINFKSNLLQQSENVLNGKIYSYNRGETSLLEVLNAQRTFNEVQSSYIEILVENHMALVELERAAGIWDVNF